MISPDRHPLDGSATFIERHKIDFVFETPPHPLALLSPPMRLRAYLKEVADVSIETATWLQVDGGEFSGF